MDGRRIYLMRHGETLYQSEVNEGAIGNGALTERGSEQIAAAALLFRSVPIDRVYASPLARAQETARIIAQEHGLDVLLSPDLQEITPSEIGTKWKSIADIFHEVQRFLRRPRPVGTSLSRRRVSARYKARRSFPELSVEPRRLASLTRICARRF
jgi:broad specificity phosphatase PhoE